MNTLQRRPFILLEVLIASALALGLIATVTFFYREIDFVNAKTEQIQRESFKLRYVENRFSEVFPRAVSETDGKQDFYFFLSRDPSGLYGKDSPTSLVFTYDNRIDLNKQLSNHVLGRLFVDPQNRLCLATWPSPVRWTDGVTPPVKLEILLDNVQEIEFKFFNAPDKEANLAGPAQQQTQQPNTPPKTPNAKNTPAADEAPAAVQVQKPQYEGDWNPEWSSEYNLLPAMIRIRIKREGKDYFFAFPLSSTNRQIIYNI